jgi:chorismate mutase/prephenate dehydratase
MAQAESAVERVYVLGPPGTFSQSAAARFLAHLARIGAPAPELVYTRTIPEALARASADPRSSVVAPIENSDSGTVVATQDRLAAEALRIEWRIDVSVRYGLLSKGPVAEVRRLYVHPVAHAQCDQFLAERLPAVDVVFTRSNTDSGDRLLADPSVEAAAVVPLHYAEEHADLVRARDLQGDPQNCTRFVVARARDVARAPDFGRSTASLLVDPIANRPGVLSEIVRPFAKYGISLCRVESRPARKARWTYVFYLDLENNEHSERAIDEVRRLGHAVTVLGTFDPLE